MIEYELIRSRRKTMSIIVHPDGTVTVRAPLRARTADVDEIVRRKAGWIRQKQQLVADRPPPSPPRQYVSGETHLYLGRGYPLQVVESGRQGVMLEDCQFVLSVRGTADVVRREKIMREWYRAQAWEVFADRLLVCHTAVAHLDLLMPELKIRLMKSRWGSCSSKGTVLLNLRLIQTPQECIDYVIFHELAHLREPNHSSRYYALLTEMLPDWRERRERLNQIQVA